MSDNHQDETNIPAGNDPSSEKKPKSGAVKWIAVAVVAVAVIIGGVFFLLGGSSDKDSFSSRKERNRGPVTLGEAWENTLDTFSSEFDLIGKRNPVFKQYGEILSGPSEHRIAISSAYISSIAGMAGMPGFNVDLVMTNDTVNKQFRLGSDIPFLGNAAIYLSDEEMIITFLNQNYAIDAKNAGNDLLDFMINNDSYDPDVAEMLQDLDLSYSNIAAAFAVAAYESDEQDESLEMYQRVADRYKDLWLSLYHKAERKDDDDATILLSDGEVKGRKITLHFSAKNIKDFILDLQETFRNDHDLREILDEYNRTSNYTDVYLDYEDLVEVVDSIDPFFYGSIDVVFDLYQDNLVRIRFLEDDGASEIELAAIGSDYLLNYLVFRADTLSDSVLMTIAGRHVGYEDFSSTITIGDESVHLEWDPSLEEDNFRIYTGDGYFDLVFTFAVSEDAVVFKPFTGPDRDHLIYRAETIAPGSIVEPLITTPLKDLNLMDYLSLLTGF